MTKNSVAESEGGYSTEVLGVKAESGYTTDTPFRLYILHLASTLILVAIVGIAFTVSDKFILKKKND